MKKPVGFPVALLVLTLGVGLTGCATTGAGQLSNASQGATVGSLLGAGLGAVIGHQSGETGEGGHAGRLYPDQSGGGRHRERRQSPHGN